MIGLFFVNGFVYEDYYMEEGIRHFSVVLGVGELLIGPCCRRGERCCR
jgi:hypothetical protein